LCEQIEKTHRQEWTFLDRSQTRLAAEAGVGIMTVRKFEAGAHGTMCRAPLCAEPHYVPSPTMCRAPLRCTEAAYVLSRLCAEPHYVDTLTVCGLHYVDTPLSVPHYVGTPLCGHIGTQYIRLST